MWFNIAAANGFEDGARNRDIVAKKMTSDQTADAERMARETVEANPKVIGEQGENENQQRKGKAALEPSFRADLRNLSNLCA